MSPSIRVAAWIFVSIIGMIAFLVILPSLIGGLLAMLLLIAASDYSARRYRNAVRNFNSAVRAVCQHDGAIAKVALAFSRSGPLSGPCYEYSRRLMMGESPIDAAVVSHVPLQLRTAIALQTAGPDAAAEKRDQQWERGELAMVDATMMPAYGQFMYLTVTAMVTCIVLAFVTVFVVPTLKVMFEEFGIELPFPELFTIAPAIGILVFLAVVGAVVVPLLNRGHLLGVPLPQWFPTMPWLAQRKAEVLHGLADALDAGWPMGRALAVGHEVATHSLERRSLDRAMRQIERGRDSIEALRLAGWIRADEAAWLSGTSPPRTGELLRAIGDQNIRDASSNFRWLASIFFPLLVLLLGLAVLAFAFGFFSTMFRLVSALA